MESKGLDWDPQAFRNVSCNSGADYLLAADRFGGFLNPQRHSTMVYSIQCTCHGYPGNQKKLCIPNTPRLTALKLKQICSKLV